MNAPRVLEFTLLTNQFMFMFMFKIMFTVPVGLARAAWAPIGSFAVGDTGADGIAESVRFVVSFFLFSLS